MMELYILIELCLKARYSDRIKRNVERLDQAIADYLCFGPNGDNSALCEVESIRKIHLEMNRRVKECDAIEDES
jgi:hypothetical protein